MKSDRQARRTGSGVQAIQRHAATIFRDEALVLDSKPASGIAVGGAASRLGEVRLAIQPAYATAEVMASERPVRMLWCLNFSQKSAALRARPPRSLRWP